MKISIPSRYRHRLWKFFEDIPRGFNQYITICFEHRVRQSICHCNNSEKQFKVTPKIAIPPKNQKKSWKKLECHLKEYGDYPDFNVIELTHKKKR